MAGDLAPAGEVGDLILAVAVLLENVTGGQIHVHLGVIAGQEDGILILVQGRALLHLQTVAADMLRVELEHIGQGVPPGVQALLGQTEHQIHGDVIEARLSELLEGGDRLPVVVGTAQGGEDLVVVALDTQGSPVEALGLQPPQELVGDGVGIGLKGDLRIGGHVEIFAQMGQNGGQTLSAEIAGGATAEIDGVDDVVGRQGAGLPDVAAEGIGIVGIELLVLAGDGVKIAVLALALAEGNVNVNTQRGLVFVGGDNCHGNSPVNTRRERRPRRSVRRQAAVRYGFRKFRNCGVIAPGNHGLWIRCAEHHHRGQIFCRNAGDGVPYGAIGIFSLRPASGRP